MSEIIFCWPRTHYDSYLHLKKLAELSEFKTCFIDEVDWGANNVYLCSPFNGEIPNPLPVRNCKFVWLQIERRSHYNTWMFDRTDVDSIWCCDKLWAEAVGAKFFFMGSHRGMGTFAPARTFDVATNCYETNRRIAVFSELRGRGYSFTPNSFEIPDPQFAASKIQVLPQQDDTDHTMTPLRFAIAAAYKMPIVYEARDVDTTPFVDGQHFFRADISNIAEVTMKLLERRDDKLREVGENLYNLLVEQNNFRTTIERML